MRVPSPPEAWERLGFVVEDSAVALGGVRIELGGEWGLAFDGERAEDVSHPNGATGIDHVVLLTDDFDATVERLKAEGLDFRRVREAGEGRRQAFFVLGPCLLEVAGPVDGGERLWGITLVAPDLAPFGGNPKDAVQPGRRITTVPREAGLKIPLAVMTPR
ncbi:MAG: glyoxalase [Actinomycetota bacterium]|nr:glyoxalase [Actinomycetota bacterium]MDQ5807443.1 glyoxalase [Actinomycetota bacterium]